LRHHNLKFFIQSWLEAVTKFKMGNKSGKKKKDPTILTQVLQRYFRNFLFELERFILLC